MCWIFIDTFNCMRAMTLQLPATQRRVTLDTQLTAEFLRVFSGWKINTTLFLFFKKIIYLYSNEYWIFHFFYLINIIPIRLFSLQSILSTWIYRVLHCCALYSTTTHRNCLQKSDIILLYYKINSRRCRRFRRKTD